MKTLKGSDVDTLELVARHRVYSRENQVCTQEDNRGIIKAEGSAIQLQFIIALNQHIGFYFILFWGYSSDCITSAGVLG